MTPRPCLPGLAALAVLLGGCPTVDLGDDPPDPGVCRPDPAYYEDVIWPEFLARPEAAQSCVGQSGCHAADTGRSALRLDDPAADPTAHDRNYAVVTRFLNCGSPEASTLLTKPLAGIDPHGGGDLFASESEQAVERFFAWFDQ